MIKTVIVSSPSPTSPILRLCIPQHSSHFISLRLVPSRKLDYQVADAMDPLQRDEQIFLGCTRLERLFYEMREPVEEMYFLETAEEMYFLEPAEEKATLRQRFLEQDPDQIFQQWADMARDDWFGRHCTRTERVVQRDELLQIIWDTPCKNPDQLAKYLRTFKRCKAAHLFLGESSFGGVLTGYAISPGSYRLHSDISRKEMSHPRNPSILNRHVLSMDRDPVTSEGPNSPRKRREENRSLGEDSAISLRSACSQDFKDTEPFCFLQLGSLKACSGQVWADVRDKGQEAINSAHFEGNGYAVVVELSPSGYPRGPVYVVYNYHDYRQHNRKDLMHHEPPHTRRLYPDCNQEFFLAKIADKLENLDTKLFDFEVVEEHRRSIMRTKLDGVQQRIIPNDIIA